ncbi:hypothetical protein AXE80_06190 [Wenyingzhuangia fucanilytica]|uniref:Uncharacterized protein n=1 Tax=Wenyingzhuangia fucanilytica TaxID=1790137 RepID=A0A1B1Y563_9FLAO|nr:c-type cytochrome domain-containing protein [Wenyingzhuangia fucanilytica]ANW95893.1 hypothetical protein AXE80_06190 [Wenyingzhuangia fucanilytica]
MNQVPDFVLFLGRFHPLIVHIPIGLILFAFLLEIISKWNKVEELKTAIPYALFLGALSATGACVLGYMLSLSGEYEGDQLDGHFWFGIATTVITFIAWLIRIDKLPFLKLNQFKANISALTLLVLLVSITGHYGGNLTHGSDYLTKYAPFAEKPIEVLPPKTMGEVEIYNHLIHPILEEKCISCHNSSKKKGGLSLETPEAILKGGKNGLAIVAGDLSKSELIHRVNLNDHDKKFMPPKGKTPLTKEEIQIISYWITTAKADFNIKLITAENNKELMLLAANFLGFGKDGQADESSKIPELKPVDSLLINKLAQAGFTIRELIYNKSIYDVVLPGKTAKNVTELNRLLTNLQEIKDHVLSLSLVDNSVEDEHLKFIGKFKNLRKLELNQNNITDAGIHELENIAPLEALNLYGTLVTEQSLADFPKFKNLKHVYLWKTKVSKEAVQQYQTNNEAPKLYLGMAD